MDAAQRRSRSLASASLNVPLPLKMAFNTAFHRSWMPPSYSLSTGPMAKARGTMVAPGATPKVSPAAVEATSVPWLRTNSPPLSRACTEGIACQAPNSPPSRTRMIQNSPASGYPRRSITSRALAATSLAVATVPTISQFVRHHSPDVQVSTNLSPCCARSSRADLG